MEFDWKPFSGGSGVFVKFENIGDEVVGKITGLRVHDFGQGKGPVPLMDIERKNDGENVTLSVDKADLRPKVAELNPQVGDMIAVKYVEDQKIPGRPQGMKVFAVKWKMGERPAPDAMWDDDGDPPPQNTDDLSAYGVDQEPF